MIQNMISFLLNSFGVNEFPYFAQVLDTNDR
jgi:hypothetical protein